MTRLATHHTPSWRIDTHEPRDEVCTHAGSIRTRNHNRFCATLACAFLRLCQDRCRYFCSSREIGKSVSKCPAVRVASSADSSLSASMLSLENRNSTMLHSNSSVRFSRMTCRKRPKHSDPPADGRGQQRDGTAARGLHAVLTAPDADLVEHHGFGRGQHRRVTAFGPGQYHDTPLGRDRGRGRSQPPGFAVVARRRSIGRLEGERLCRAHRRHRRSASPARRGLKSPRRCP